MKCKAIFFNMNLLKPGALNFKLLKAPKRFTHTLAHYRISMPRHTPLLLDSNRPNLRDDTKQATQYHVRFPHITTDPIKGPIKALHFMP